MKKIFTLLLVLGGIGTASAQNKVTFGPKIGVGVSNSISTDDKTNDMISGLKVGMSVGGFVEWRTAKWFALSADVLFTLKGSKGSDVLRDGSYTSNVINNYRFRSIDVPLLMNFYLVKGLAIKAGIQPEFMLSAKNKYLISVSDSRKRETAAGTDDLINYMHQLNLSIPVGISYSFKSGLILDLRYNIAVTNIISDTGLANVNDNIKTPYALLSLGWKF